MVLLPLNIIFTHSNTDFDELTGPEKNPTYTQCYHLSHEHYYNQKEKADDETNQLFVFFPEDEKVGVKPIKILTDRMKDESVSNAILVLRGDITPFAKQAVLEMSDSFRIEHFKEAELLVDITDHTLVRILEQILLRLLWSFFYSLTAMHILSTMFLNRFQLPNSSNFLIRNNDEPYHRYQSIKSFPKTKSKNFSSGTVYAKHNSRASNPMIQSLGITG